MSARSRSPRTPELDHIVETMIHLMRESRRIAREKAAAYGITPTQLAVVRLLSENGALSLSSLSERLRSQNSTVTGIADRMERDGLIVRQRDPADRRVWKLRLTPRGRRLAHVIVEAPWDTLRDALGTLGTAERGTLLRLLGRIAAHVRAAFAREEARGRDKGEGTWQRRPATRASSPAPYRGR